MSILALFSHLQPSGQRSKFRVSGSSIWPAPFSQMCLPVLHHILPESPTSCVFPVSSLVLQPDSNKTEERPGSNLSPTPSPHGRRPIFSVQGEGWRRLRREVAGLGDCFEVEIEGVGRGFEEAAWGGGERARGMSVGGRGLNTFWEPKCLVSFWQLGKT